MAIETIEKRMKSQRGEPERRRKTKQQRQKKPDLVPSSICFLLCCCDRVLQVTDSASTFLREGLLFNSRPWKQKAKSKKRKKKRKKEKETKLIHSRCRCWNSKQPFSTFLHKAERRRRTRVSAAQDGVSAGLRRAPTASTAAAAAAAAAILTQVYRNLLGQVSLGHMIASYDPRPVLANTFSFFSRFLRISRLGIFFFTSFLVLEMFWKMFKETPEMLKKKKL